MTLNMKYHQEISPRRHAKNYSSKGLQIRKSGKPKEKIERLKHQKRKENIKNLFQ